MNSELSFKIVETRITSVETFVVAYPVTGHFKFFVTRDGKAPVRSTVVIKITDDHGNIGWGQSVPSPTWSYETIESVRTTIDRHLGLALVGLNPFDEPAIEAMLKGTIADSFSTGQPICKAGIDLALFDLTGRILNQSAAKRWSRKCEGSITLSWTIDTRSVEEVGELVSLATERGFHHFNIKVTGDAGFDVELCREIRRLAPDAFAWVDANCGYDVETAKVVAPKMAELNIAALEQPFPANRLSWFRELRQQGALPVLMDEPIVSVVDLEEFHRLGLLDGVAMKLSRCGGLTEARRILEFMEENGLLFFASGLTDPDLSLAASLSLYSAFGLKRPAALNGPQFLSETILTNPIAIAGDQATVPIGFGLGVEVDLGRMAELSID